jgi:SAM-dependent methyltransferase
MPADGVCRACGASALGTDGWDAHNVREHLDARARYVVCSACRSLNLRPSPSPEELQRAYEGLLRPPPPPPERRRPALRHWVRAWVPNPHEEPWRPTRAGARLLDVGCGDAVKLRPFKRGGWECYGTDLSASAIETAAREHPRDRLHAGATASAPFPRDAFDVVRSDNVVEHLLDPAAEVREMARFLRVGGLLKLYVPHAGALTLRVLRAGSVSSWVPFHLTLFSTTGMRALLNRAGLEPVELRQYSPIDWLSQSVSQTLELGGVGPARAAAIGRASAPLLRPLSLVGPRFGVGEELIATARRV